MFHETEVSNVHGLSLHMYYGSKVPVITGGLALQNSYTQCIYVQMN